MIRRAFALVARHLPYISKRVAMFTALYAQQRDVRVGGISCSALQDGRRWLIEKIQNMSIKIKINGLTVGHAYCFTDNYLVSVSQELLQRPRNAVYEFHIGEERLKGSFRIIGHYENLTFIECTLTEKITPLVGVKTAPSAYSDVQLVKKKEFMSVRRGCFITEDSGYGIIDGEGEIGSLVVGKDGIAGITVQMGKGEDKGFMRAISWNSLMPILNYVKGRAIHLGISTQALQNQEGLTVVRVAPNSPLKNQIMMGDIILRANGQRSNTADALFRICLQSGNSSDLTILRQGRQMEVRINF